MKIQDFTDMKEFEKIMANWANATGLATVAVGADGKYISEQYNFTEFCNTLTRGSKEGCARCVECDRTGKGVYNCHAGLIDFGIDLVVDGQVLGTVLGGQVLPEEPDEEKFRKVAREIGVNENRYITALHKVNVRTEKAIHASANLLGQVLNNFLNAEYAMYKNSRIVTNLQEGVTKTCELIETIKGRTGELAGIQGKQRILALNASIEAARVGEAGKGFSVVATEVQKLSETSSEVNRGINEIVADITSIVNSMAKEIV